MLTLEETLKALDELRPHVYDDRTGDLGWAITLADRLAQEVDVLSAVLAQERGFPENN